MKKLITIALATGIALGAGVQQSIFPPRHEVVETYNVKDGDTLWKICSDYCDKDCRRIYVSQMVDDMKELNPYIKIRNGLVLTGDKIKIRYMEFD